MKCLVLAGGSGDALWPLSRRNYPKQFMHVNKGRSLFQEAIARNLPFCDEFYIVTNRKYENIVHGQLQTFQGMHYHLFLEEIGRQTAPAVMIACLCMNPQEQVLVVSTDHRIEGGDYNGTIVRAQSLLSPDAKGIRHRDTIILMFTMTDRWIICRCRDARKEHARRIWACLCRTAACSVFWTAVFFLCMQGRF